MTGSTRTRRASVSLYPSLRREMRDATLISTSPLNLLGTREVGMRETYFCMDGRQVTLMFNEETLTVSASNYQGDPIANYQAVLIGPGGEEFDLMDDPGDAAWFRLEQDSPLSSWHGQGITERVLKMVEEETGLLPLVERTRV